MVVAVVLVVVLPLLDCNELTPRSSPPAATCTA